MKKFFVLLFALIFLFFINSNSLDEMPEQSGTDSDEVLNLPATIPAVKPENVQLQPPSMALKLSLIPFVYNSLYRLENTDSIEYSSYLLSRFEYLVCAEPGHLSEKEKAVSEKIKHNVRIFGYVNMGGTPLEDMNKIKNEIAQISQAGWYGVFFDQFGYDFGETRQRQNDVIDFAHSLGLSCFVNAWFIDDVFDEKTDSRHNPQGAKSSLSKDDWYLMESFYSQNSGYVQSADVFLEKCKKASYYKDKFKVKIATLTYKRDAASWENTAGDIFTSYLLSALFGFDGYWYTDKLESDSFLHGTFLYDIGNTLTSPLKEIFPGKYLAETDRYVFLYDAAVKPVGNFEAFRASDKQQLLDFLKAHR